MGATIGAVLEQRLKSLDEQVEEEGKMSPGRKVREEREWTMSLVHMVQESLVTTVRRKPASAVLLSASNGMDIAPEGSLVELYTRCAPHRTITVS